MKPAFPDKVAPDYALAAKKNAHAAAATIRKKQASNTETARLSALAHAQTGADKRSDHADEVTTVVNLLSESFQYIF